MPTVIQTGRVLDITIATKDWSPQTSSVVLQYENNVETYQTLDGPKSVVTGTQGTLSVTAFQDYKTGGTGLADALWTAAAAGTAVACTLSYNAGAQTFTFNAIPQFPTVGGDANAALTYDVTMTIDGAVTKA